MSYHITLLLPTIIHLGVSQINLGSFNLKPDSSGKLWNIGFNQGGSIFGFGGDRGFNAQVGEGVLGFGGTQGAVVGGERIGTDSQFGVSPGGINLGSDLNFGQGAKTGDLNSFIKGIGDFFKNLSPPPSSSTPMQSFSSIPQEGSSLSRSSPISPMDGDVRVHREEKTEEEGELILMSDTRREDTSIHVDQTRESSVTDDDSLLHSH